MATTRTDDDYRRQARRQYQEEGELEIDDDAEVSRNTDIAEGGAWVAAWVWVDDPEEG